MMLPPSLTSSTTEQGQATVNMFNRGTPEVEGEIYIDGTCGVGHVAMRPEYLAAGHLPISRFGEDAIGLAFPLAPRATIKRFESIALWMGFGIKAMTLLVPGAMERVNITVLRALSKGSPIIEEAGGLEAYDRKARSKKERLSIDEIVATMKKTMRPELVKFEE